MSARPYLTDREVVARMLARASSGIVAAIPVAPLTVDTIKGRYRRERQRAEATVKESLIVPR